MLLMHNVNNNVPVSFKMIDLCPVCYDSKPNEPPVYHIAQGAIHSFHLSCLRTWWEASNLAPICPTCHRFVQVADDLQPLINERPPLEQWPDRVKRWARWSLKGGHFLLSHVYFTALATLVINGAVTVSLLVNYDFPVVPPDELYELLSRLPVLSLFLPSPAALTELSLLSLFKETYANAFTNPYFVAVSLLVYLYL